MKNKAIKSIALLLISAVLLSFFAACNTHSNTSGNGGTKEVVTEAEAPVYPDVKYPGEDFTILVSGRSSDWFNDFSFEEGQASVLDTAIYKRNLAVEEQFGVKIATIEDKAAAPNAKNLIMRSYLAQDNLYDAAMPTAYDVTVLSYSSYLYDLNSLPTIDLGKPWWDQKANKDLSIRGTMFFTTGDFGICANDVTHCIVFNKELAAKYEVPDLYELVESGKWTLDTMTNVIKMVSDDLDANGTRDDNDLYGLLTWDDAMYAVVNGAGQKCCTINPDGEITLTLGGEKVITAIEKYMDIYNQTEYVHNIKSTRSGETHQMALQRMFSGNQTLMLMFMFKHLAVYRDTDLNYGIIPFPKLDEAQEEYAATVSPWHTNFICVPYMIGDEVKSGTVLEALCYESSKYVKPAYYEKTLIGRTLRDDESIGMLDIIFGSRLFDVGYYYQPGEINKQLLIEIVRKRSSSWASVYERFESPAKAQLAVINKFFLTATQKWEQ